MPAQHGNLQLPHAQHTRSSTAGRCFDVMHVRNMHDGNLATEPYQGQHISVSPSLNASLHLLGKSKSLTVIVNLLQLLTFLVRASILGIGMGTMQVGDKLHPLDLHGLVRNSQTSDLSEQSACRSYNGLVTGDSGIPSSPVLPGSAGR